jgi:hypothetical protein
MKTETRMNMLPLFWNFYSTMQDTKWYREFADVDRALHVLGGEAFAESFDQYRCAWFIKYFEKICPH